MPQEEDVPLIGIQLAQALDNAGVSQKELARRLAGTGDTKKVEAKRRWVGKILDEEIKRPGMARVERALNLPPGHFRLPAPQQTRVRADRQARLEEEVAKLRREFDSFVQAATERQAAQEVAPGHATQQSDQPSTGRQVEDSP